MNTVTFHDLAFRARHAIPSRGGDAAIPHVHSYVIRMWFSGKPDHRKLSRDLKRWEEKLNGISLHQFITDSSDEGIAEFFLNEYPACVRVAVTTDGNRGAEASI